MERDAFERQLLRWRHYLHQHPEAAMEEENTSAYLANELEKIGLEVNRKIGGTGLVANLTVGTGKKVIGLRADMDCILINETQDYPYKSQTEGKMHACGHDGHMATLLGAAALLSERKDFDGTVRFFFQPGEEPGVGARAMIEDGVLVRFPVDEIYGMHNIPLPEGTIVTRVGGIMASEDNFVIHIAGKGGHASSPHFTIDPMVIAAEIILALQTIVSRNVSPIDTAVVSCTELITDGVRNAIPSNITIKGDTRSFKPEVQRIIEERMRKICEGICAMHGASCEVDYTYEFSPTVNEEKCTQYAIQAAKRVVGESMVDGDCAPLMVSEDFGLFLQKVPGCFVFIGNVKDGAEIVPLHNAQYDYNDTILKTGAEYFAELVRERLPRQERARQMDT